MVSTSESVIVYRHQSAATTEFLEAACLVPCCSLSTPRHFCQRHRTLQKRSPCPVRRRHSTIHRSQHWQGTRRYQRLFPVRRSLLDANGLRLNPDNHRNDRHWYHCKTKVGTRSRRRHSRRRYCSCYDTIRDATLTCARKLTWVSLIYRTEPTTKKCKTEN